MPIYEYVCTDCGEPVEKLQKIADAPLTDCPACGQAALKRKVSAASFRLSGNGWYETDFKSKGQRNLRGGGSESGKDSSQSTKSSDGSSADKSGSQDQKKSSGEAGKSSSGQSGSQTRSSKQTA